MPGETDSELWSSRHALARGYLSSVLPTATCVFYGGGAVSELRLFGYWREEVCLCSKWTSVVLGGGFLSCVEHHGKCGEIGPNSRYLICFCIVWKGSGDGQMQLERIPTTDRVKDRESFSTWVAKTAEGERRTFAKLRQAEQTRVQLLCKSCRENAERWRRRMRREGFCSAMGKSFRVG